MFMCVSSDDELAAEISPSQVNQLHLRWGAEQLSRLSPCFAFKQTPEALGYLPSRPQLDFFPGLRLRRPILTLPPLANFATELAACEMQQPQDRLGRAGSRKLVRKASGVLQLPRRMLSQSTP